MCTSGYCVNGRIQRSEELGVMNKAACLTQPAVEREVMHRSARLRPKLEWEGALEGDATQHAE